MRIKNLFKNIKLLFKWKKRKSSIERQFNDKIVDISSPQNPSKKTSIRKLKNIFSWWIFSILSKNLSIIIWFILIILIWFWVNFMFAWEKFKISEVEIISNSDFISKDLSYLWAKELLWRNIFLISTKESLDFVSLFQKNLKYIKLKRLLPSKISIEPISYPPLLYFENNNLRYIISENWVLLPYYWEIWDLYNTEIYTLENPQKILYTKVFPDRIISKIKNHLDIFSTNFLLDNIEKVTYFNTEKELHIDISWGPKLIFDIEQSPDIQLKRYLIFTTKYNISDYYYIDLRIDKKVFACENQDENLCIENLKRIYNYNF